LGWLFLECLRPVSGDRPGLAACPCQEIFAGQGGSECPDLYVHPAFDRAEDRDRGHAPAAFLPAAPPPVQHRRAVLPSSGAVGLGSEITSDRKPPYLQYMLHFLSSWDRPLYALAPTCLAAMGDRSCFCSCLGFSIIPVSIVCGGPFAQRWPALSSADMFRDAQFRGAIHGRLLTAWSTAGIIGPGGG